MRSKQFEFGPMSVQEAILQMNLIGHSFFAFRNEEKDGAFSVVYRRNDGGYGILVDKTWTAGRANRNLWIEGQTAPEIREPVFCGNLWRFCYGTGMNSASTVVSNSRARWNARAREGSYLLFSMALMV